MKYVYQVTDITDPYDIAYLGIFSTIEKTVDFLTNKKNLKSSEDFIIQMPCFASPVSR